MAGSFTDYLEDALLKHVFTNTAYTSPSAVYLGLFTVAPTDTGGGTELSGSGYARQAITFAVSGTDPTLATNSSAIEFPTATGSWGTLVAVAVFDALTTGNMLAWADLASSRTVGSGDIFRIPANDLDITLA
jgi:hypothetical protein